MTNGAAAGGAAAAGAAIAQAIKASGVLVHVRPDDFVAILTRQDRPLVVVAKGGFFTTTYKHLTSYKGLGFYCKADQPLKLPPGAEVVEAQSIWLPG